MRRLSRAAFALLLCALGVGCVHRDQAQGPALAEPWLEQDRAIMADGRSLVLRRWLPEGAPLARVIALHGFSDYGQAFALPGACWAALGLAVWAPDQRGFGDDPQPGIWAGTDTLVGDALALIALARAAEPPAPVILLGHSMGGAVALLAAREGAAIDALVLVAPATWGRRQLGVFPRVALWLTERLVPGMVLDPSGLDIRPSDNDALLRAMGRDPLMLKDARVDTTAGLVDLMGAALQAAPAVTGPALVVTAGQEEVLAPEATEALLSALPRGVAIERLHWPRAYHMALRDRAAAARRLAVADWMLGAASARPADGEAERPSASIRTLCDRQIPSAYETIPREAGDDSPNRAIDPNPDADRGPPGRPTGGGPSGHQSRRSG